MEAMRCEDCGDVRWSFMGFADRQPKCELCGGQMVPERRNPMRPHAPLRTERRGAPRSQSAHAAAAR